jgi:transcriptional regulator with XRE-family HTH domain
VPTLVRLALERYSLTQQALGDLMGVSDTAINLYMNGTRVPGKAHRARLDALLAGEGQTP